LKNAEQGKLWERRERCPARHNAGNPRCETSAKENELVGSNKTKYFVKKWTQQNHEEGGEKEMGRQRGTGVFSLALHRGGKASPQSVEPKTLPVNHRNQQRKFG